MIRRLLAAVAAVALTVGLAACDDPTPNGTGVYPTPANSGLPEGWTPTSTVQGDLNITTPDARIEGVEVFGSINVMADGALIRNSRVHGRIWNQHHNPATGNLHQWSMVVMSSTVGEPDGSAAEITQHGTIGPGRYVAVDNELYGSDGFRVSAPAQGGPNDVGIEHNYFRATPFGDLHLDGVQGFFGGTNVTIRGNTLDVQGAGGNGAVFMADCSQSAVVTGNLLKGGAFTLRIHDDNGNPPPASSFDCGTTSDVGPWEITGNRIVEGSYDYGPALTTNTECGAASMTWGDNRLVTIDAGYGVTSTGAEVGC